MKTIPKGFFDIGGWSFEKVWEEKQEFCEYALKISNCTGFMKEFQDFCRQKKENAKQLNK